MMNNIKRIFVLTKRNIKEITREPLSLIFTIVLPLLLEVIFYFLFNNLTSQFQMKYLAPGIVVFSQAFLTLFTGLLISLDRHSSFLTRLYVSKARPFEFIFSYAFALLPIAFIQSILFFLVGGIIDLSIFSFSMIFSILISLISALFFIAMGILFGSICNEKSIGGVSSIIITGQSVLSGMWFPTEGLSKGFMSIMKILPFRSSNLLVQNVLNGIVDFKNDLLFPLLLVLSYTIVAFVIAILAFKKNMKG